MFADTRSHVRMRTMRTVRTGGALGVSFAVNALVQFAIQAWLAFSFASHVWHLPGPLPFAAPIALDAFVVNMMVVTYELRDAHWRVRMYAWCVLSLGVGAQIGAAEGFALWAGWGWWARIASFAPALLLAASLHTLIIRRREARLDGQEREIANPAAMDAGHVQAPPTLDQSAAFQAIDAIADRVPVDTVQPKVSTRKRTGRRQADRTAVDEVRRLVSDGISCADAAAKLGRSKRWAELATKDIRAARDATQRDQRSLQLQDLETGSVWALSPKGSGPGADEMHGDVAAQERSKGTPAIDPDVPMQD